MHGKRDQIIDFLRGIVILDMILVHFKEYLDVLPWVNLSKLIGYSDFAIEGFILLSGYMVGSLYLDEFGKNGRAVAKKVFKRVFQVIKIQYLFILTISLPLALVLGNEITGPDNVSTYIAKSALLFNQVGVLHILPTFIPLFLLILPILYFVEKNRDWIVISVSAVFFAIGNFHPYVFNVGDKTIFPVVLWQVYFVLGILLGKRSFLAFNTIHENIYLLLLASLAAFGAMSLIYHGHHIAPFFNELKATHNITVSKFPLNFFGLLYHGSILSSCYCLTVIFWERISRLKSFSNFITLFGRHSLLAFAIHVFFCKAFLLSSYLIPDVVSMAGAFIVMNIIFAFVILTNIEKTDSTGVLSELRPILNRLF